MVADSAPGRLFCFAFPLNFSWIVSNMIYKTGITKTPKIVPTSIPPTAPVPIDRLPFAPTPVEIIRGIKPKMNASEVIKIGRNRALAASIAACTIGIPFSRLATAYCTIRIAFFAKSPISMTTDICI